MFFGILWIIQWFKAQTSLIAMVTTSTYYFNSNAETEGSAELDTGIELTFKYHLGSLAVGSFIIALIQFIKFLFLYFA